MTLVEQQAVFTALLTGSILRKYRREGREQEAMVIVGGEPNFHLLIILINRFETLMHGGKLTLTDALEQLTKEGYTDRVMRLTQEQPITYPPCPN
jgi:hypothetical protein